MASDTRADETHDTRYETNFIFHLGRHCNANFDGWFNSHYPLVSSRSESGEKTTKDVTKHGDVNNEAKIKKRQPLAVVVAFWLETLSWNGVQFGLPIHVRIPTMQSRC